MLGLAIVLPFISTAAVLGTGGSIVTGFPPYLCTAKNSDVIYYTYILPLSTMMGIGLTLEVLVLQVVVRMTTLKTNSVQEGDLQTQVCKLNTTLGTMVAVIVINPRRVCAARVTVLSLCVCVKYYASDTKKEDTMDTKKLT